MPDRERVRESPERALWMAVLLQAKQDIEDAKAPSMDFQQAVSFLAGDGAWAEARESVALILDMEPGFIARTGLAWIKARHERDMARRMASADEAAP